MAEELDDKVSRKQQLAEMVSRIDKLEIQMKNLENMVKVIYGELTDGTVASACRVSVGRKPLI